MTINESGTRSAQIDIPTGRYRLLPELTAISFTAKKFGVFTIKGTMRLVSGTFTVASPLERSILHSVVDADSFTTPMRKRDEHVKGPKLLDTATYPNFEFDSTDIASSPQGGLEIRGLLALHGKVAPAVLTVDEVRFEDGLARVKAHASIDRRDFGVTAQRVAASWLIDVKIEAVGSSIRETRRDS